MPRSRAAALYDRKSSVTNRSGAKANFSEACASVSVRHACCAWIGPVHREPRPRRRRRATIDHPPVDFQIDSSRCQVACGFGGAFADARRSLAQNGSPSGARSRRGPDPALSEQIFDVTKAEREPEIEPNRLMYDLGPEPISGVADFPHALGYSAYVYPSSCRRRDKAIASAEYASPPFWAASRLS